MRSNGLCVVATLLLVSPTLVTSAAAQLRRGLGGGPIAAPHIAAPAPRLAAPAPHIAMSHIAAPRFAPPHVAPLRLTPHIVAPHTASPRHAVPNISRGRGALARRKAGPPMSQAPAGPLRRETLVPPTPGNGGRMTASTPSTVGQGTSAHARNLAGTAQTQTSQTLIQGSSGRWMLRNPAFASLSPRDPATRALAQSTFSGRFAQSSFARDFDWRRHRPRYLGIVLGFIGPLFWPYAYEDFVEYTFWGYAYDTFWPYAYDDVFEGIYGAYAPQYYAYVPGGTSNGNANAAAPRGGRVRQATLTEGMAQICLGPTQGLTDFPIERIAQQVEPDPNQQALLEDLKDATAKALDILQAACPSDLPSTPIGRLAAMRKRVETMLQVVEIVRPALEKFHASLSDEQKERFNVLDTEHLGRATAARQQPDLAQICSGRAVQATNAPIARIERALRLSDAQEAAVKALDVATAMAAEVLRAGCPTEQTLTPTGRLAAMERRLDAMLQALDTVQPALAKFYNSLDDEQKAQFNRLGPPSA
jgi:LTXXQ motif family protein